MLHDPVGPRDDYVLYRHVRIVREATRLDLGPGDEPVAESLRVRLPPPETRTVGSYEGRELFTGHSQKVKGIGIARNGQLAVSAGHDFTARLWSVESGKAVRPPFPHPTGRIIMAVAITPDGSHVITGTRGDPKATNSTPNGAVRIWDTATGKNHLLGTPHRGSVLAVAFSPDGRTALSGGADGVLILWDVKSRKMTRIVGRQPGSIHEHGVAYFPDGRRAATAGEDDLVHIWDLEEGKLSTLTSHPDF